MYKIKIAKKTTSRKGLTIADIVDIPVRLAIDIDGRYCIALTTVFSPIPNEETTLPLLYTSLSGEITLADDMPLSIVQDTPASLPCIFLDLRAAKVK